MSYPSVHEVARSLELYNLEKQLKAHAKNGEHRFVLTKEPALRSREDVDGLVAAFGSYDPFSVAHEELFLQGLDTINEYKNNELVVVTATAHFQKSIDFSRNSTIYDRIHAQETFASVNPGVSLAFFNDPYFTNLQNTLKETYTNADLHFLVGADVMQKIADPSYYRTNDIDQEEMLDALFTDKFIVSERNIAAPGEEPDVLDTDALCERYETIAPYYEQMIPISLHTDKQLEVSIEDVSSTLIRTRRQERQPIDELVSVGISDFVDKRGLYLKDPTKYAAYVSLRQHYADTNEGKPIRTYIDSLMNDLECLYESPRFMQEVIESYNAT